MTLSNYISETSFNQMNGWCTWEKANLIFKLVQESKSEISVELGTYAGRSLTAMACAHKDNQKGFIVGFDAYKNSVCVEGTNSPLNDKFWMEQDLNKIYRECIGSIEKYSLADYCSIVKMRSEEAGKVIKDNCIDVLHQDSNHNVETIIAELELWSPKVKTGGYWIADDVQWVEAKEAYAKIPDYGFDLIADHFEWHIYRKIK